MMIFLFLILVAAHTALVFYPPDLMQDLLIATIYIPFVLFQKLGLPVGINTDSGWSEPNMLGYTLIVIVWLLFWFLLSYTLSFLPNLLTRKRK